MLHTESGRHRFPCNINLQVSNIYPSSGRCGRQAGNGGGRRAGSWSQRSKMIGKMTQRAEEKKWGRVRWLGEHGDNREEAIRSILLQRQCQCQMMLEKIEDKAHKKALVLWLDYSVSPGHQWNKEVRTVLRLTRNQWKQKKTVRLCLLKQFKEQCSFALMAEQHGGVQHLCPPTHQSCRARGRAQLLGHSIPSPAITKIYDLVQNLSNSVRKIVWVLPLNTLQLLVSLRTPLFGWLEIFWTNFFWANLYHLFLHQNWLFT